MADPKPVTFYAPDGTVLDFASTDGMSEQCVFTGGKHTTSNPVHVAHLERYVSLGVVSTKPVKDED